MNRINQTSNFKEGIGLKRRLIVTSTVAIVITVLFAVSILYMLSKGEVVMSKQIEPYRLIDPLKPTDYTYSWWTHGLRGETTDGKKLKAVQTGNYGFAMDVEKVSFTNYGIIDQVIPVETALTEDNDVIFNLPNADFEWKLITSDVEYLTSGSKEKEKTRTIDSGRFVQRFDLTDLTFESTQGDLIQASGRLEIIALPDFTSLIFAIKPETDLTETEVEVGFQFNPAWSQISEIEKGEGSYIRLTNEQGEGIVISSPVEDAFYIDGSKVYFHTTINNWIVDLERQFAVQITPIQSNSGNHYFDQFAHLNDFPTDHLLVNRQQNSDGNTDENTEDEFTENVNVVYDHLRGWYQVDLTYTDLDPHDPTTMERIRFEINNPTSNAIRLPLFFLKYGVKSVTGFSPMIRDIDGFPSGIPVQISKNWHSQQGQPVLYDGNWFHGFTIIEVPPNGQKQFEFDIVYSFWGGVPAVSHAQLSLIGWGGHQQWDQVAIGSFGENITYDPDVGLNRSMIDDVRPFMVSPDERRYVWSGNVGGGDFLVYYDANGQKQYLSRMKTYFKNYAPNLTEVTYAGISADGNIAAEITVSSPRTDDINRAYHKVRYEVLKDTPFSRLAFYQLGADKYNNHQFNLMAIGNADGLIEEWQPGRGGLYYERQGIPINGDVQWFSLHDAIPGAWYGGENRYNESQAWANRGLIVRNWNARIGGEEVSLPHYSVYLTENNVGSSNVELSPPAGVEMLKAGDYIEFEVELVIIPMSAEDYYGPNEPLRQSLEASANTWEQVYRLAVGNDVQITASKGEIIEDYPLVIQVDQNQTAEFEIVGGLAYFPITITGLDQYWGGTLERWEDGSWQPINQEVNGNDYWQAFYDANAEHWELTFNVLLDAPLDAPEGEAATNKFRFRF